MEQQTETASLKSEQTSAAPSQSKTSIPAPLSRILSLNDFEQLARRYLPHSIFTFVNSGVEDELTLRDNRSAFEELRLRPRVLVGVSERSQQTTLLGRNYSSPFGVAPMGMASLIGYRGDLSIARACAQCNIPYVHSGASLIRLEDIHDVCPTAWFQAYLPRQYTDLQALLRRVANAGFETLVVTVDMTAGGNRENMVRAGFSAPFRPSLRLLWEGITHPRWSVGNLVRTLMSHGMPHFENIDGGRGAPIVSRHAVLDNNRAGQTWEVIRKVRADWRGKLVIKGLLDPRDVRIAVETGADAIVVSTHGGRQIDGVVPALHALASCVEAAGDIPVMMDSGIRRGTDVIKCLALGAKFVFVGRPLNYAAILGTEGVRHGIGLLQTEIGRNMGNMGINRITDINRNHIVARSAVPGWRFLME